MTIARLESIRQRLADEAIIKAATPEQHLKLAAALLVASSKELLSREHMLRTTYTEVVDIVDITAFERLASAFRCSGAKYPEAGSYPILCERCGELVGNSCIQAALLSGSLHRCTAARTVWNMASIYALADILNVSTGLLTHYLITEHVTHEQHKKHRQQTDVRPASICGFERLESLAI